ncbi:hypothetical protein AKJ57_05760 [candidate division MSBL1 archaeon SCGC-AAA259A05]|uniref:Cytochrome c assembly protein domain-containing protein n=1 Tax=candidate division MSBL1 archaeon SCGC-AAA259A05 TaxID=1698259 RepID=A0A133U4S0_9EURY|nr:hypothetical protein AKJ57_05760 [candidate division MSBL1 archaeon SCGC-AAA259A05]
MWKKINNASTLVALVTIPIALYFGFQYAPLFEEGFSAPYAQKIFYFHVSAAISGYVGFFIVLLSSIAFLKKRDPNIDRWAVSAAEVGVVLLSITILIGPLWAKAEWGVFWRLHDPKLMSALVLWLVYIGYVVLRRNIGGEREARLAAVYAILGFTTVPISFVAQRIWRSLHPTVIVSKSGGMGPKVATAFGFSVIAFLSLFAALLIWRKRIEDSKFEIKMIKEDLEV